MRESKDTQYECVVGKIGWDRLCLPSDDEEDLPTLAKPLARSIPAVPPMRRKLSYHLYLYGCHSGSLHTNGRSSAKLALLDWPVR
jgi:hypothetical protein